MADTTLQHTENNMDSSDVANLFASLNLNYQLKREQLEIISHLCNGENVFCVLPTGFGKSECFSMTPRILQKKDGAKRISIVISPLRSLMKEQCEELKRRNISAACVLRSEEVDSDTKSGLVQGEFSLVFFSPETVLLPFWRNLLRSKIYKERLCLVTCDEAHCIIEWGESFRPQYREIGVLRSLMDVPILFLTATATVPLRKKIIELFDLSTFKTVAFLPDRPNIYLSYERCKSADMTEKLNWLLKLLKTKTTQTPKTIIYCSSIQTASDIFIHFQCELIDSGHGNLIQQYHSAISSQVDDYVLATFKSNGPLRVLVSTIAFGMGVSIPDVRYIIHWGCSKSPLAYWQEIGRGGRDGGQAYAILYCTKIDARVHDSTMIEVMKCIEGGACIRLSMLEKIMLPEMQLELYEEIKSRRPCEGLCDICVCHSCKCCSNCRKKCPCNNVERANHDGLSSNVSVGVPSMSVSHIL